MSQGAVSEAGVVLVLTGTIERLRWRYGERSYRYLMLEAGHIAQNVYVEATALGLGCCAIGAFYDEEVDRLLGVDGQSESTVYLLALGPKEA